LIDKDSLKIFKINTPNPCGFIPEVPEYELLDNDLSFTSTAKNT
jgi:hypothetical protein